MEAVKAFNTEMASMLDMRPPISRAKMMSITKAGMKAIKLYKHVVQIIEKFIKKCNPELKVPGLYVVDSIIRQSRYQFGEDKDVFGPRFLKNISATFQSLYECPTGDKDKILRVLNLWQKNSVFSLDVIQPLVDMASGHAVSVMENGGMLKGSPAEAMCVQPTPGLPTLPVSQSPADQQTSVTVAAVAQFLQSAQGLNLQQILRTLQQGGANPVNTAPVQQNSSISKVLDRFDYDEEQDVEKSQPVEMSSASSINFPVHQGRLLGHLSNQMLPNTQTEQPVPRPNDITTHTVTEPHMGESGHSRSDDHERRYSRRSRSRSPRRRSSPRLQPRTSSRHSRYRRSRSRSHERRRTPPRSRGDDRKEVDRRHKGLPATKRETLSVCSTTLWLGQLDKKTQQQDISSLMEEFGQIESINMIPPRGCAYIVMVHRQDAYTALNKLGRGTAKINHKSFKIAWAMNKGVGSRFKKYWNMELGVTYIPWEKLKDSELSALQEGAVLDQETLKPEWASLLAKLVKPLGDGGDGPEPEREGGAAVVHQVPAVSTESAVERMNTLPADVVVPSSDDSIITPPTQAAPLPLNPLPPPFISPFSNILRPPPGLPPGLPTMSRTPIFRVRLPMAEPTGDFPHPGVMEAEHWNGRPFRNDRGPPEWFGPEPPFRHGGWSRGGHWGHGQFRN